MTDHVYKQLEITGSSTKSSDDAMTAPVPCVTTLRAVFLLNEAPSLLVLAAGIGLVTAGMLLSLLPGRGPQRFERVKGVALLKTLTRRTANAAQVESGPLQSNRKCLLDLPLRSHLNPKPSARSVVATPQVAI